MRQEKNNMPDDLDGKSLGKAEELILTIIYIALFTSVVFSWRAYTSITIIVLTVASFAINKINTGSWLNSRLKNPFLYSCLLFSFVQLTGLFYTDHWEEGISLIFKKASIIILPLAILSCDFINSRRFRQLMFIYIHILGLAMLYCLGNSTYQYYCNNADLSVFFYHSLVSPVLSHAIYFSILSFAGLAFLLDALIRRAFFYNRNLHLLIIILFFVFITLLSSKLIIVFSLVYTLVVTVLFSGRIRSLSPKTHILILGILLLIIRLVFFTSNPIQKRYLDITQGNIQAIFQKEKFGQDIYFNGVQFRLLQWRFVGEILTEQNAWIWGVSPGDAQHLLDEKYTKMGLFIGDGIKSHGFLGYNTHNQFLESLLQSGIPGLLAFCLICFSLIKMMLKRKNHLVSGIVLLQLLYTFNEAYLETQYGIFITVFLPLFFYFGTQDNTAEKVLSPSRFKSE